MDDWFALMGSSIPLRGAEVHTLQRPFWFSRGFMLGVGHLIEKRGVALVPGTGNSRHAFIALDDVAAFLVKSVGNSGAQNAIYNIGGPEVLSWNDVVGMFSKALGRPIRAIHTPATVFRAQQLLLSPFSRAASNLMAMNWLLSVVDTPFDMSKVAPIFGIPLTNTETFLRNKLSLPAV